MPGQKQKYLDKYRNTCIKTEMTEQNEQKYLDKMNRNTWKKTEMPGQKKQKYLDKSRNI